MWKFSSIFIFVIQLSLAACAMEPTLVNHSFSFNTLVDSPEPTVVLDYQYGSSSLVGTHANKEMAQLGKVFGKENINGAMPRGDFLYVKWRVVQSGQEYEDRVDLKIRLPADIEHFNIHFVIRGPQLYVYLMPPGKWPIGSAKTYPNLQQYQIYPDRAK